MEGDHRQGGSRGIRTCSGSMLNSSQEDSETTCGLQVMPNSPPRRPKKKPMSKPPVAPRLRKEKTTTTTPHIVCSFGRLSIIVPPIIIPMPHSMP